MSGDACTWPEQNVIEDWLRKYNLNQYVDYRMSMELKEAVTAIRLKCVEDAKKELRDAN